MIGYCYVNDTFRKAVKGASTLDDIRDALNFYFEMCDEMKVPIEVQWRCVGIIFDQYRKENYDEEERL